MAEEPCGPAAPAPWQRPSPFTDAAVKLMRAAAEAVALLPNQFWGLIILGIGASMIPYATERTLAIIGGIITAGANLLTSRTGKRDDRQ